MLINELRHHAAGLEAAADAIELQTLQVRLRMAAQMMEMAARRIEDFENPPEIPAFLRKQAE